ncbi:MAG TPA: hypothetical protein VKB85_10425 [Propionibacteriaceae bacterium]|nr:hypothetical protein [Propionibacteriaceae bacterium]
MRRRRPAQWSDPLDDGFAARQKGLSARVQMSRDLRNRKLAVEEARRLAELDRRYEERLRGERGWA